MDGNYDKYLDMLIDYVKKLIDKKASIEGTIVIYGFNKFMTSIDSNKFSELLDLIKKYEKINIVVIDDATKIKSFAYESWFGSMFSISDGIWIGKGIGDQTLFRISNIKKEMLQEIKNDMGYVINESNAVLCRLIDFVSKGDE